MNKKYSSVAHDVQAEITQQWHDEKINVTPDIKSNDFDVEKPKFSVLDFFPFPSGRGLHIGHPLGYIATDVIARKKRMEGYNVLYSMGFDAFGLPTEQHAIETGQHPKITTDNNVANMKKQLEIMGLSHDPERVFSTTDPDYYKWTQSIFLQMYNSFYDPEAKWQTKDGLQIKGKARDITELKKALIQRKWHLTKEGVPVPASSSISAESYSENKHNLNECLNKARLAYIDEVEVLWCPKLSTVLSKEEITPEGVSERGGHPVYRKPLRQWMLRISAYSDRLIDDLDMVDWPHSTKEMQKNWIGRQQGTTINFSIVDQEDGQTVNLETFTTRPETLHGVTALIISPKHEIVQKYEPRNLDEEELLNKLIRNSEKIKRKGMEVSSSKEAVALGLSALNPITGEKIPVYTSDYIISDYGSGAVMAVPAHDQRDFEFAQLHSISARATFVPDDRWLVANQPNQLNDESIETLVAAYLENPLDFKTAYEEKKYSLWIAPTKGWDNAQQPVESMNNWLQNNNAGSVTVNYRLRDWIFSRQRYWGEPFPIVHNQTDGKAYALKEDELPVILPDIDDYAPKVSNDENADIAVPLTRADSWKNVRGIILKNDKVKLINSEYEDDFYELDGQLYPVIDFQRELNTMPNWAGSSWYYLRYADPKNNEHLIDPETEKYWAGNSSKGGWVDLYVGGAEHAVLHLLYARFWHKFLLDKEVVSTAEPFHRLFNQGMITGEAYKNEKGIYIDIEDVDIKAKGSVRQAFQASTGNELSIEMGKIGKRYKNGVAPEILIQKYNADTFRLFELYLGPLDKSKPWSSEQIVGMERFCNKVWALQDKVSEKNDPQLTLEVNDTVKSVSENIDTLRLNVAIADLIKLTNTLSEREEVPKDAMKVLTKLLAPFAPFLSEKIYSNLFPEDHKECKSIFKSPWPEHRDDLTCERIVDIPVAVNGKRIGTINASEASTNDDLIVAVQSDDFLKSAYDRALSGRQVETVVIPRKPIPRIINFVLKK